MTVIQLTNYVDKWLSVGSGHWVNRGVVSTKLVPKDLWGHVTYGFYYTKVLSRCYYKKSDGVLESMITVNDQDTTEGKVSVFILTAARGETQVALTLRYLGEADPAQLPEVQHELSEGD